MALAVNGAEKWFVPQNRRGQFTEGPIEPELGKFAVDALQPLPKESDVVYFIPDETDSATVMLWATKEEYDAAAAAIKIRRELAARPKIRIMEQLIERQVPSGEAKPVVNEIFLHDFLKQHPVIRNHDPFATSGDFYQTRKRWFEVLTPQGWVVLEKDPRQKPKGELA